MRTCDDVVRAEPEVRREGNMQGPPLALLSQAPQALKVGLIIALFFFIFLIQC